jgi:hypothetical protein
MDGKWERAARVMTELMSHHLTLHFQGPVPRDGSAEPARCDSAVGAPRDLGTILGLIRAHAYAGVREWLDDVELVWANYEAVHPDPVIAAATGECRRLFECAIRKSGLYPLDQWYTDVTELQERLDRKLRTVPQHYRAAMYPKSAKRAQRRAPVTEELRELARAVKALPAFRQIDVSLILMQNGELPIHATEVGVVDLGFLKEKTVRELQEFVATTADD